MNSTELKSGIAVVGYAMRMPGCATREDFWAMLERGGTAIEPAGEQPAGKHAPDYVALRRAPLDVAGFDAEFFSINEREARLMDPQRRLLLECAHSALEDAGEVAGYRNTGTYLATSQSEYFLLHLASHPELFETFGGLLLGMSNGQDFAATYVAYKLDLHGPSLSINTACSSSLVAVHQAVAALLSQECDMALAGGASISLAHDEGYFYKSGGINSRAGRCRPFDADADGTLPGSGAAVVVLKRLEDALRAGDAIRAVIAGTAVNNDGARKVGFSAPSVAGQMDVLNEALGVAGMQPDAVDMIETHGTGTALGDAIEFAALREVFAAQGRRAKPLYLGSLKGNVGHTNAAAGAAALIKVIVSLEKQRIPPMAGFKRSNAMADLDAVNFIAPQQSLAWAASGQRRWAGVSSFGIGGTNAHVILTNAPSPPSPIVSGRPSVLLYSAHDEDALRDVAANLATTIAAADSATLADIAYTSATGRQSHLWRGAAIARDADTLAARLAASASRGTPASGVRPMVAFFAAPDASCFELARTLITTEPVFSAQLQKCLDAFCALQPEKYSALREHLRTGSAAPSSLISGELLNSASFCTGSALAALWASWGCRPETVVGYGIGEYAAAHAAGILTLADAVYLVHTHGLERAPLHRVIVPGRLGTRLLLASAARWVNAGDTLEVDSLLAAVRGDTLKRLSVALATAGACRIVAMCSDPSPLQAISETGFLKSDQQAILATTADRVETQLYAGLAAYWQDGGSVDWQSFYGSEPRRKHPLPAYPYRRKRHWIDRALKPVVTTGIGAGSAPLASDTAPTRLEDWLYTPGWERTPESNGLPVAAAGSWLILDNGTALCREWLASATDDRFRRVAFSSDAVSAGSVQQVAMEADAAGAPAQVLVYFANPHPATPEQDVIAIWMLARNCLSGICARRPLTLCVVLPTSRRETALAPHYAAAEAALRVLPQEIAGLRACAVGLWQTDSPEPLMRAVQGAHGAHSLLIYVGADLHRRVYRRSRAPAASDIDFRPGHRYLMIGGMGHVGRILSEIVSRDIPLTLTFVGREWMAADPQFAVRDLTCTPPARPVQLIDAAALRDKGSLPSNEAVAQTGAAKRLLSELAATVSADYAEARGMLAPGAAYSFDEWSARLCVQPSLRRIAATFRRILSEAGWLGADGPGIKPLAAARLRRRASDIESEIAQHCPDFSGTARRLIECARQFPDVLIDGRPGIDVLYPNGSDAFLQSTAPTGSALTGFARCSEALLDFIARAAKRRAPHALRILEIGAGSGSLSRQLIPALANSNIEYCFTDVGRAFLAGARQFAAANDWPWFYTRPLDITQDPLEQGFACGEFDLIVGFNVIHIAPRLEECLARLAVLLRPDGTLALLETVGWHPAAELVWGLTPDWWRFEDPALRSDSPLLTRAHWIELLSKLGFGSVAHWPTDEPTDEALLLASAPRRDWVHQTLQTMPRHSRQVAHLHELVARGCDVEYLRADLLDPLDLAALRDELCAPGKAVEGIVHAATTGGRSLALLGELSASALHKEFGVKVGALQLVTAVAEKQQPAFVAVMSSMSSVLGGLGHIAYAAANAFEDAACIGADRPHGTRWLALNWDAWGSAGRTVGTSVMHHQMEEEQAVACMRAALRGPHAGQVLVSRHDLAARIEQWIVQDPHVGQPQSAPKVVRSAEQDLACLWAQVLDVEASGDPDDDFFQQGGDSLLAIQLIAQVRQRFGHCPDLAEFMRDPTLRALQRSIATVPLSWSPLVSLRPDGHLPPIVCVHPGGGSIQCYQALAGALQADAPVHAIMSRRFAPAELPPHPTIEAMAAEYVRALRTVHTRGPLVLLGYCFGGMVSYEMARQLSEDPDIQLRLVLVDAIPPGVDDGYLDQRSLIEAQLAQIRLSTPVGDWIEDLLSLSPREQARAICARFDWSGVDRAAQEPMVEQTVLDIIVSNEAKNKYRPAGRLDVPVHLMRIDDAVFHRDRNSIPHLGWQRHFGPTVEVSWFEGGHLDLFSPDRITSIAQELQAILTLHAGHAKTGMQSVPA